MRRLYSLLTGLVLCLVSMTTNAQLHDNVNFTFSVVPPGNHVNFTNTSVLSNTEPRKAVWSFGDGSSSTTTALGNADHTYSTNGVYTVCLRIYRIFPNTNDSAILTGDVCKTVAIQLQDSCRANFEQGAASNSLLSRVFYAQPWHNNHKKVERVCWNFGDGKDTCINYTSNDSIYRVTHNYAQPGNYNACVTIKYQGGCESHFCKPVVVGPTPDQCSANYGMSPVVATPLARIFYAIPTHNNNKKPERICWTFGDGKDTCISYDPLQGSNYTVLHSYLHTGTYNVCLKIRYQGGCEADYCRPLEISVPQHDSCRADFETGPLNTSVSGRHFTAVTWHSNNKKPERVCWNFGDGRDTCIQYSTTFTGPYAVDHFYTSPGQYNVCVKILYQGGCESAKCKLVPVAFSTHDSCSADFERIPVAGTNDLLNVYLHALPWHNNQKKPKKVCWQFGDGRDTCIQYEVSYTGQYNVNHHYAQPGTYQACVNIVYDGGCESRRCKPVVIAHDTCSVQLLENTTSDISLIRVLYISPYSGSNNRPTRICWIFGDGKDTCINLSATGSSLAYMISHQYPSPGTYRACVKVLFSGGCEASNCREVVIRSNAGLCGAYMTDSLTGPRTVKFRGFGIGNPSDHVISYSWSFGDGTSANTQDPVHIYREGGTYNVCLSLKMQSGCESHTCKNVVLPGANQTTLQLSPNPVINNLHVVFFSNRNESVTIRIMNSSGMIVKTYTRSVLPGSNVWDLELAGLVTGLYSITVQSPNQLASGIFFKQ